MIWGKRGVYIITSTNLPSCLVGLPSSSSFCKQEEEGLTSAGRPWFVRSPGEDRLRQVSWPIPGPSVAVSAG